MSITGRLALSACVACGAVEALADIPLPASGPVHRSVPLRTEDDLALSSFLDTRPAGEGERGQALLGLRARSELPELAGDAVLEYSVAVPDGGDAAAAAAAEHRLVRLQLDSRWRQVDYALNLFSVGEGFAVAAPGQDHLRSLGLPGAGRGAELTAAWHVQDLELQPRVRRIVRDDGAARRLEEARSLRVSRALWDALDVAATIETATDQLRGDAPGAGLDAREAMRTRLEVAGTGWQLAWSGANSDRRDAAGGLPEASRSTEVGLRVDGPGSLRIAPRYREDRRRSGGEEVQLVTGRLGLSAALPLVQHLQLELEYRQRQEAGADASGVGAVLKMRQPWLLAEHLPQGFLMDASVSWRQSETVGVPLWDDGLAFSLSLEYRRSVLQ